MWRPLESLRLYILPHKHWNCGSEPIVESLQASDSWCRLSSLSPRKSLPHAHEARGPFFGAILRCGRLGIATRALLERLWATALNAPNVTALEVSTEELLDWLDSSVVDGDGESTNVVDRTEEDIIGAD